MVYVKLGMAKFPIIIENYVLTKCVYHHSLKCVQFKIIGGVSNLLKDCLRRSLNKYGKRQKSGGEKREKKINK